MCNYILTFTAPKRPKNAFFNYIIYHLTKNEIFSLYKLPYVTIFMEENYDEKKT